MLATVLAAVLFTGAKDGDRTLKSYEVEFDNAFGLVKGADFKVGGVRAGELTGFELTKKQPFRVRVQVEMSEPGFDSLREDASCAVRQQSLIGEYFVDCDLGRSKQEIADGGLVPAKQTSSTIPPDLIANVMRRPYRERFRIILTELGTGLAGRPEELNEVIRRAHPALRETNKAFKILADQNRTIADFIEKSDRVSAAVEPKKEDVARWAREASDTATIQASRKDELQAYWRNLPVFLGELEPTMKQLGETADEQIPLLRKLDRAAPDLEDFLAELGPFAESSRGSTRALGRLSKTGLAALRVSKEEIKALRALSVDAPKLGRPLRQFLQSIDDRGKSTESDPSAEAVAPPAPDKTAFKKGQGFTGMESLLNYFYFQTLAINAFDDFGHVLRIGLLSSPGCGPFNTKPDAKTLAACGGGLLGPTQPGILTPDPTKPAQTAERRERAAQLDRDERRKAGDPEAPATPGQIDPSKPQITLPPATEKLLKELKIPGVPGLDLDLDKALPRLETPQSPATPQRALDFLLAP
ncbi:MAG: MCE family protein [Thermoleophilaceae bacterium]|nr:MCE family protein [Thermoleophilaceae bacterium]